MKNILLLYASSEGESIVNALRGILDPEEYNIELSSEISDTRLSKLHSFASSNAFTWMLFRFIANTDFGIGILNKRAKKISSPYIEKSATYIPDVVVSLHPLMNVVASSIANYNSVKSISLITDVFSPSKLSTRGGVDYIIVPLAETKDLISKWGVNTEVLTYPIDESLLSSERFDASQIFEKLNLPKQFTVLFSGGRFASISKSKLKELIQHLPSSSNLIILSGNDKVKVRLESYSFVIGKSNIKVMGKIDNLSEVLLISDVHFTTSATQYFFESLASQTPLYIYSSLNDGLLKIAKHVKKYNLGKVGSIQNLTKEIGVDNGQLDAIRSAQIEYLKSQHIFTQKHIYSEYFKNILGSS